MKKNITINLFGALYAIDEDAYELLKQYQENMRRYFSRKEGGEEIADDIEHRVAELLAELKSSGVEAIAIEHIEEIIQRIGNPEQMDDEEEGETPAEEKPGAAPKRLFRDPEDMMLGGVMSGLAHYFGGLDPIWWRLAMVLLCIFSTGFALIGYVVLWVVMPVAITPEDRLRMWGRPVNTASINEEMMRGVNKAREAVTSPDNRRRAAGCLATGMRLIVGIVCFALLCGLAAVFIGLMVAFVFLIWGFTAEGTEMINHVVNDPDVLLWFGMPGFGWQVGAIIIAGLGIVVLPAYVLIRRLLRPSRHSSSAAVRTTLVVTWVVLIALVAGLGINLAVRYEMAEKKLSLDKYTRKNTRLTRESWSLIDSGQWDIKRLRGCGNHIVGWQPNIVTGNNHMYFEFGRTGSSGESMEIDLCRTVMAEPGTYRLEGLGLADYSGAKVYVSRNDTTKILGEVPVSPRKGGGNLKDIPWSKARTVSLFAAVKDSVTWDSISHSGRYQNYIESKLFHHPGGPLTYGFCLLNTLSFEPWLGNRLAIINLRPVKISDGFLVPAKEVSK